MLSAIQSVFVGFVDLLRFRTHARYWLAGPATLLLSIVVMAASSLWLPEGRAQVDHLVFPLVLFPLIWSVIFMYVVLENNQKRAAWVLGLLFLLNAGAVYLSITGALS